MEDIRLKNHVILPATAVTFTFSRSGGKGGQHVNKVSTKAEAVVDLAALIGPEDTLDRIRRRLSGKIDKEGMLRVVSQESRSQWQNRKNVIAKVIEMIDTASYVMKQRRATKPTLSSSARRLESKKKRSSHKSLRRKIFPEE